MNPRLLRLCVAALTVAGFLTLSSRASAETIDTLKLTLTGGGPGIGGPFTWTQTGAPNTNFATSFSTYCIDTQDSVKSGTFTTHTDLTKAPTIGNGTAAQNTAKVDKIINLYDHFYNSSFLNSTTKAAFQDALWSLVYGTSTSNTLANNMLNGSAYNGVEHALANASLVALVDSSGLAPGKWGRNQDQLLVVPNTTTKPVPAPPALMLAGIGMLALFGRSRWTRRTPAAA